MTIQDQVSAPTDPGDNRVSKFINKDAAQTHVENECLNHGRYQILTIAEAKQLITE